MFAADDKDFINTDTSSGLELAEDRCCGAEHRTLRGLTSSNLSQRAIERS